MTEVGSVLENLSRHERALLFERLRQKREQQDRGAERIGRRVPGTEPLPLSFARRGESVKDLSSGALSAYIGELKARRRALGAKEADRHDRASLDRRLTRAQIEYHSRLSFSLACLTFPLVAFALVMVLEHRSRLTHFFLGNLMVVTVFFPLLMAGQLAAESGFPAVLALAFPNVALAAAGAALFRIMLRR